VTIVLYGILTRSLNQLREISDLEEQSRLLVSRHDEEKQALFVQLSSLSEEKMLLEQLLDQGVLAQVRGQIE
jgi:hypothetical protein